ncbi:MAG: hypothetical protein TQ35_0000975 [Candidatus Aramenus sulfurataquae]|uniref:Uncharacterized protein n=1 Tax=Candidatus Aramenus sulfurataquae TaxID=1326980 RepID=A0ACC6TLX3_9CREN
MSKVYYYNTLVTTELLKEGVELLILKSELTNVHQGDTWRKE